MEAFIFSHAYLAHWVIFGLFMLAGLNFPISEDLLIIAGGGLGEHNCSRKYMEDIQCRILRCIFIRWCCLLNGALSGS